MPNRRIGPDMGNADQLSYRPAGPPLSKPARTPPDLSVNRQAVRNVNRQYLTYLRRKC